MNYVFRRRPLSPFALFGDISQEFDRALRHMGSSMLSSNVLAMDVQDKATSYEIKVDLPENVQEKDVEVVLDRKELTIAIKPEANEETRLDDDESTYLVRERAGKSLGSVSRSLRLPQASQSATASIKGRLLTIEVKKEEESKPQHIQIAASQ
jgi:HSP20 family molecular chaperone IbpA